MIEEYIEPTFTEFIKDNLSTLFAGILTIIGVISSIYFGYGNWKKAEREKFEKNQLDVRLTENTEEFKTENRKDYYNSRRKR